MTTTTQTDIRTAAEQAARRAYGQTSTPDATRLSTCKAQRKLYFGAGTPVLADVIAYERAFLAVFDQLTEARVQQTIAAFEAETEAQVQVPVPVQPVVRRSTWEDRENALLIKPTLKGEKYDGIDI
jgi:hypothetical protein